MDTNIQSDGARRPVLTVEELSELLGISKGTTYRFVHDRWEEFGAIRAGRKILIPRRSVKELLGGTIEGEIRD
jgi:excisionase family DNA binding protein